MKHVLKNVSYVVIAVLLPLLLIGCGDDGDGNPVDSLSNDGTTTTSLVGDWTVLAIADDGFTLTTLAFLQW